MDIKEKLECIMEGMDWEEVPSILGKAVLDKLRKTPNTPPPPPSSFPAGPPATPQPTAAASVPPAAPSSTCSKVLRIPDGMVQSLRPVVVLNSALMCELAPSAPPLNTPALPLNTPAPEKRTRQEQQDEDRPYIKKPPNAFMLFLKEQRAKVKDKLNINDNAAVNAVVGVKWKSLSKEQQAKYYEQAEEQRILHAQQHPEWSSKDNYGKKKRSRGPTCSTASACKPLQEAEEAECTSVSVPVCDIKVELPQENQRQITTNNHPLILWMDQFSPR